MEKPFALIIDDDRDTVALFRHVLDLAGYKTEIILHGEKAMQRLESVEPDIVLLDLNLPGVPGLDILKYIRSQERFNDTHVVIISGYSYMAQEVETETDLVLLKPVSVDQLKNLVLRIMPVKGDLPVEPSRDQLTGLYTRPFFMSRLEYSLERSKQLEHSLFAVLFIDFDNFKQLNEEHGTEVGDAILKKAAEHIDSVIRPIDTHARVENDHFLVLLENLSSTVIPIKVADRIENMLADTIKQEFGINVSISIGLTYGSEKYKSVADIIRDVDIALYAAKQNDESYIEFFNETKHGYLTAPEEYKKIARL